MNFLQNDLQRATSIRGLLLLSSLLTGCASAPTDSTGAREYRSAASPRSVSEVLQRDGAGKPAVLINYGELTVGGVKLKNTQFDFPIVVNSRVEYWVDYFTNRGRPHFEKYLERSEYFIPYIRPLLKQNGMPEDLVYLAMIESGFNNHARSRAKAVGPWQFISATGKRYGLAVNWWVDERRDIRKSTLAAVEYLRDLYGMFQNWELASASYNSGEAKIARAIQRFGSRDFWVIARHRFLRPETRDYVPKIIAAALISKNREQFGFKPTGVSHPGIDETVASDGSVVKVEKTDKPEEDLDSGEEELRSIGDIVRAEEANGENDDAAADSEDESDGRLNPAKLLATAESASERGSSDGQPLARPVPTPHVTRDGHVGGEELTEFDVRSPADLLKVARAAGLSYQTVKSLNPEVLRWCTPPSAANYRIRLPASTKEKFLQTYNHAEYPRKVQFMTYKVKRGETITNIARHFGIQVDPIADLNRVSSRAALRAGTQVVLPIPNDRSRSLASLDLRDPPSAKKRTVRTPRRGQKYYKVTYKRREAARTPRRKATGG